MSNQTHLVLASAKLAPQTENAFNSKVAFRLSTGKVPHQFRRRRRGVPQLPATLFRGPGQLVSGNLNLLRLDLDAVGAGGLAHTKPRQEVLQGRNEAGMHQQLLEEMRRKRNFYLRKTPVDARIDEIKRQYNCDHQ